MSEPCKEAIEAADKIFNHFESHGFTDGIAHIIQQAMEERDARYRESRGKTTSPNTIESSATGQVWYDKDGNPVTHAED